MSISIRKSPILLAIKIISLELLVEIIYLTFGIIFRFIAQQAGNDGDIVSLFTQILLLPLQLYILVALLLKWASEEFEITDKEIIIKHGVIKKESKSYLFINMQSLKVTQTAFERIAGAGTISIHLPTLRQDLVLGEIPSPQKVADDLKKKLPDHDDSQQIIIRR